MPGLLYQSMRKVKWGLLKPLAPVINKVSESMFYDLPSVPPRQPDGYDVIKHGFIDAVVVDGFTYKWDRAQFLEGIYRQDSLMLKQARPGDVVLDIGANIGAEGIPLARKVKHVYCIEPLMTEILHQNIIMNSVKNITVLECGLGPAVRVEKIQYDTRIKKVQLFPFQWFLQRVGHHVDYLCCDCEGPEWNIDIKDCEGIRAFWIEFHIRRNHETEDNRKMTDWLIWWHKKNYKVECSKNPIGRGEEFKDCYHFYASPRE